MLGRVSNLDLSALPSSHANAIQSESAELPMDQVKKFYRILLGKQVYFSAEYTRVKAKNSYTIEFKQNDSKKVGKILYFVYIFHALHSL